MKSYFLAEIRVSKFSGIRVVYNISRPEGDRVVDLKVRCQECDIPIYEDLDEDKLYNIAVCSYIVQGGDSFTAISENIQNLITGQVDMDIFRLFLEHRSPVFEEIEDRIVVVGEEENVLRKWND